MAGDWIPIEIATPTKPEIIRLARLARVTPDEAVGICVRLWCWISQQTETAYIAGVTPDDVDHALGRPGMATHLAAVGWLAFDPNGVLVPNFDRHLSESAKKRAMTRERQKRHRQQTPAPGNKS